MAIVDSSSLGGSDVRPDRFLLDPTMNESRLEGLEDTWRSVGDRARGTGPSTVSPGDLQALRASRPYLRYMLNTALLSPPALQDQLVADDA